MNFGRFVRAFALTLAAASLLGGCDRLRSSHTRTAPDTLEFSILPRQDARALDETWRPFFADMQAQTGLKAHAYIAPSYDAAIEAMRLERTQAGWFSNAAGLEAVKRAHAEVFASADLAPDVGFRSILVARAASGLTVDQTLRCGRRLTLGLGDPRSTSGTLAPLVYLFEPHGIAPQACFKAVRSANHEANLVSVADGVVDVATSDTAALQALQQLRPEVAAKLKVLWSSSPLPGDPILWRKDLDPSVKEKLRAFFLSYGKADGPDGERQRKILARMGFGLFRPDTNDHFLRERELEAARALWDARQARNEGAARRAEADLARIRKAEATAAKAAD